MNSTSNQFTVQVNSGQIIPGQTLVTSQGTWSFGTQTNAPGNFALLLNGVNTGGGFGAKMKVQGSLYTLTSTNRLYKWGGADWSASTDAVPFV